jgi:hypothetical protein
VDEIRSAITQSLSKVLGVMGASVFVWLIPKETIQLNKNTLSFSITLVSPTTTKDAQQFGASLSFTRAIGMDKIVLRVVN